MNETTSYTVRTLFLANYREAATKMVEQRHSPTSTQDLANAIKRLELADKVLEEELNRFSQKGYELVSTIEHDLPDAPKDLVLTAILKKHA